MAKPKNIEKTVKTSIFAISTIVMIVGAIVLYGGLPKRVEATELKNGEQDEALHKLVSSMDGYTKAQEQRNRHDLEMRQLLIDMIAKNTDRIDYINR